MQNERHPIRRSAALAPLSRDHHDGLLLAWKIRQGIKHHVPLLRIAAYCQWFLQHHLLQHFEQEERVLVPFLGMGSELSSRIIEEHRAIKTTITGLVEKPEPQILEQLASLVTEHIRFEERTLFNEVEKLATPQQLAQMGKDLEEEKVADLWEDEFWVNKQA
jgi:iron-sulfur cluster repair protein YtfE (RIC family)